MSDQNGEVQATAFRARNETNLVAFTGRVAETKVARQLPAGDDGVPRHVVTLDLINNRIGANGQTITTSMPVVIFGQRAVDTAANCPKGREITVEGRIQNRSYDDVSSPQAKALGQPIRRKVVEILTTAVIWGDDPSHRAQREAEAARTGQVPPRNWRSAQPEAPAAPAPAPAPEAAPQPKADTTISDALRAAGVTDEQLQAAAAAVRAEEAPEATEAPAPETAMVAAGAAPDVPVADGDIPF
ncbi:MAG TPA: single-stranded DNA-binding protein [Solirubrobacterales bacterium]